MKIAATAAIASTLLHPALCSNLRRKDVDVSNRASSSVEGMLLKTLRHPSISLLHSKLLKDEPATMPAPSSDEEPCTAEVLALLECEGVAEAGQCLEEISTEMEEDTTCEQLKSDPEFCPKIVSCFDGVDAECAVPKLEALVSCAEANYPADEDTCDDLCAEPEQPGFMQTSETKYDGYTKSTIKDKCNNPSNCNACEKDCPSKYKKGCKEWKDCNSDDHDDDDDDNGNRSSKKYDGYTEKEINDKCDKPKNCNACKKDCPSNYKKGCKDMKGCAGEDILAIA